MRVELMRNILEDNTTAAHKNTKQYEDNGVLALDLLGSPGSGKTSVLERVISHLSPTGLRIKVIEGDVASANDAERIEAAGAEAFQINTGGACHLHAGMVSRAMKTLRMNEIDILLIENVGNLVCPTAFPLGAHARVVVASVPEGDDKPEKYPEAFRQGGVIILNKMDLLQHMDFDVDRFWQRVRELAPAAECFEISCTTGAGIHELCEWIQMMRRQVRDG